MSKALLQFPWLAAHRAEVVTMVSDLGILAAPQGGRIMGSKRAQKAKKRAQREAKREVRRARSAAQAANKEAQRQAPIAASAKVAARSKVAKAATKDDPDNPLIGYMAAHDSDIVRYEDDCLVAESREEMERTVALLCPGRKPTIFPAHFQQLVEFMKQSGEVLRFDAAAQARFSEAAARRGTPITDPEPEDLAVFGLPPSEPSAARAPEPSEVAEPTEPPRSTTLLAPAYVVKSEQCCPNCLSISVVFALGAEGIQSRTPSRIEGDESLLLMSEITWLSTDLRMILTSYSDGCFFPDRSSMDTSSHYVNHCDNCGAPLDDFELFLEPGAAFFPMTPEDCQRMTLFRLLPETDLSVCGNYGSSTFPWQQFARRQ
jgi:hypothetical protein